jgi:hypothetical protein
MAVAQSEPGTRTGLRCFNILVLASVFPVCEEMTMIE